MMRKLVALFTVLALLFCFAGCGGSDTDADANPGTSSTNSPANTESGGSSSQSTSSKQTIVFPDPVTGTYNGKTVTLALRAVTDFGFSDRGTEFFINGYTTNYDYAIDRWVCLSTDGTKTVLASNGEVDYFSAFDSDGIAVARMNEHSNSKNKYNFINTKGEFLGAATREEFDKRDEAVKNIAFDSYQNSTGDRIGSIIESGGKINGIVDDKGNTISQFPDDYRSVVFNSDNMVIAGSFAPYFYTVRNADGKLLCDQIFEDVSNLENGLCAFVTMDGKLGIIAENGEIVIPGSFEIDYDRNLGIYLSEGYIIAEYNNVLAFFQVTVE